MSDSLPSSWASAELQQVTLLGPKPDLDDMSEGDSVHFVPMAAVGEDFGGVDVSQLRPIGEVRKGYTYFAAGDVLFAKITPCMENGKGGLVPNLEKSHAYGSTELHVLRPTEAIDGQWLAHFLSQPSFRKLARRNMTGTAGQLRVPSKWLQTVRIPVPPRNEQRRIVAKLEELLSDLDAGVAELKAAQKKLQQYRQSLLKAAVEGALTADWREAQRQQGTPTETGAQLLARILTERRARWEARQLAKFKEQGKTPPKDWQKKYPEPVQPDKTDLPALPEGWVWATISQIATDERHGLAIGPFGSNLKVSDYQESGIPLVFVRNIRSGCYGGTNTKYVTPAKAAELSAHSVAAGDVLVTKMGEPPGDADVYPSDQPPAIVTADCIKIRCCPDLVLPEFLKSVINSQIGKTQILPMTKGVAQKKVSLDRFQSLSVPVPSFKEQAQIAQILKDALYEANVHDGAIEQALNQSKAQRQNVLRAAFLGQLVGQDPKDEPARSFLERLQAEKAKDDNKPNARKNKKFVEA